MANYRFGDFELLARERRLLAGGQACAIGTRALDLLVALVERRDRVVTKCELLELAWPVAAATAVSSQRRSRAVTSTSA